HGAAGCPCVVEIKSAADARDGLALFPDAPTSRGRRHLLELADLAERGIRAAVIFAVQRADGRALAVNRPIDPEFAAALEQVAGRGVEVYAYRCPLTTAGIALAEEIPVLLTAEQAAAWRPPEP
ncbi:MAG TPA: DNA/RNA nuclease SfsA, partial [Herpetosiphonaceae bacterium]